MARRAWILWGVFAAIVVLPVLLVTGWLIRTAVVVIEEMADGVPYDSSSAVSCADAMEWAKAKLPADTHDEDCRKDGFMDPYQYGSFRMDRSEVEPWLRKELPELRPEDICPMPAADEGQPAADRCWVFEDDTLAFYPQGGPYGIELAVAYEDETTALVRFAAYTA
ncbi:hypothetical protein SRB5_43650 [Streptomyces sp. RB5]|uniref:Uncharacterized protein n=1 Tax=Streptomyces smaragdinus TaxID=2585196 RepID=A0A7K0CLR6_9ACTN|nr:hypothetical protein [Streptomyces smaragdinus]MQY14203.1 hypothetical protein [Streptomyces smaragdinus]